MPDSDTTRRERFVAQYRQLEADLPERLVLWRNGDFYEAFGTAAETVARELEMTLTSYLPGVGLCGVPAHAVDRYVDRLLGRGVIAVLVDDLTAPPVA